MNVGVIKTAGNIRIYCPIVFCVVSGRNQSYYPECDWERLLSSYLSKVKGRTSESE